MFTIMIGFCVALICAIFCGWIGFISILIVSVILTLLPIEGYNKRENIEEISLLKLKKYKLQGVCRYAEIRKKQFTA